MSSALASTIQKPMVDHLHDLRRHLTWVVIFIGVGAGAAFSINEYLLKLLQDPLGETLYYTSPTGGLSFTFKLCATAGIVFAFPVILLNIFKFIEPVLDESQRRGLPFYALWSFIMAYAGIAFAYYISLPNALKFLTNFGNGSIQSLINVNEYFNFALSYVAGFALLFQLPLIVLFINRIKPLKPGKMMSAQRYIIVISFIVAAILTPTPDPMNQFMMAAPMIILYQLSIVLVMIRNSFNRGHKKKHKPQQVEYVPEDPPIYHHSENPAYATMQQPVHRRQPILVTDFGPAQSQRTVKRQPVHREAPVQELQRAPQPAAERILASMPRARMLVGNDMC
jgi:sec-independent protein translocase protein TatC